MTEYPKPNLTADIVAIRDDDVLLIRRGNDPFKGKLALPGGFVDPNETVYESAMRELYEETNLEVPRWKLQLVDVFSKPGRDPRGWVISTCFVTKVSKLVEATAGDDASELGWHSIEDCTHNGDLAFDHARMVAKAVELVRYR